MFQTEDSRSFHSEVVALGQKFPTAEALLKAYNPDMLQEVMRVGDVARIYYSSSPHLAAVSEAYGSAAAESWIVIQLSALSEFAGVKDKLDTRQLSLLSTLILGEFGYLRMSEFMYFCGLVMSAHFGQFYGSVDAMRIMDFLRQFTHERLSHIAMIEQHRAAEDRTRELERRRREAVTWEEWQRIKEKG